MAAAQALAELVWMLHPALPCCGSRFEDSCPDNRFEDSCPDNNHLCHGDDHDHGRDHHFDDSNSRPVLNANSHDCADMTEKSSHSDEESGMSNGLKASWNVAKDLSVSWMTKCHVMLWTSLRKERRKNELP